MTLFPCIGIHEKIFVCVWAHRWREPHHAGSAVRDAKIIQSKVRIKHTFFIFRVEIGKELLTHVEIRTRSGNASLAAMCFL